jgi:Protein involved in biosynthesis of mitomycin antibiotics/polyketide fumonisin
MHDLDPVFEQFSRTPELAQISKDIGFKDPRILQSMFIFKQPHIGGEVVCHQDATFLHTEPLSVKGFWFALEDATQENGCMWAIPGGHKSPVKSRFFRSENGEGTEMEVFKCFTLGNIQTGAPGSESRNDGGASRATSTHELPPTVPQTPDIAYTMHLY